MATLSPLAVYQSLRRADERVLRQVRALLARAVALGTDAREVARSVRAFFSPWAANRRSPTGGLLRAGRGAGSWPGKPGAASAHDRALMAHTANVAHAEAVLRTVGRSREPMGVRWVLAPGHRGVDVCTGHARRDSGHGQGVFVPADLPPFPAHYACRCLLSPQHLKEAA